MGEGNRGSYEPGIITDFAVLKELWEYLMSLLFAAIPVSLITNCSLVAVNWVVQLWKRSGAWFYKGLPRYIRPAPKKPVANSSMRISSVSSSSRNSGSFRSSSAQGTRKTYSSWSRSCAPRELLR